MQREADIRKAALGRSQPSPDHLGNPHILKKDADQVYEQPALVSDTEHIVI